MKDQIAVHCEARKIAYRQTRDGLVVSFVIHPEEMPDALATAPLGQRYMLALAAIGDDEQPIPAAQIAGGESRAQLTAPPPAEAPGAKSEQGKQRYAVAPERQQAVVRSALYPKDSRFRAWLVTRGYDDTEAEAAAFIRHACGVKSRRDIDSDEAAYQEFLRLETTYRQETGLMAEVR